MTETECFNNAHLEYKADQTLENGALSSKMPNHRCLLLRIKSDNDEESLPSRSLLLKGRRVIFSEDDTDIESFEDSDGDNDHDMELNFTVLDIEELESKLELLESTDIEQSSKLPGRAINRGRIIGLQNCTSCLWRLPSLIRQNLQS
mmetsp:Transcript_26885/g.30720  ORF Transcript_26885/g.30720 Transcript_26885/m.30720 type:complete len:147 (-) Transcript_26885:97-537(-)